MNNKQSPKSGTGKGGNDTPVNNGTIKEDN